MPFLGCKAGLLGLFGGAAERASDGVAQRVRVNVIIMTAMMCNDDDDDDSRVCILVYTHFSVEEMQR